MSIPFVMFLACLAGTIFGLIKKRPPAAIAACAFFAGFNLVLAFMGFPK
jgi:uncharacterized membrane protein